MMMLPHREGPRGHVLDAGHPLFSHVGCFLNSPVQNIGIVQSGDVSGRNRKADSDHTKYFLWTNSF